MTITGKSTRGEAARRGHEIARRMFTREELEYASLLAEQGDERSLDHLVRLTTAWRGQMIPNPEYDEEERWEKHRSHALGIWPNHSGPNFDTVPLAHRWMTHLFGTDGSKRGHAARFDELLKEAGGELDTSLKGDDGLGVWKGDNTDARTLFNIGYEDFIPDYRERFPDASEKDGRIMFLWCKRFENEGLPRDFIFNSLSENGYPTGDTGHTLTKALREDKVPGMNWTPSLERIGDFALYQGTYMLPVSMNRDIEKWKLLGAKPGDLKQVFGRNLSDIEPYMKHHSLFFHNVLGSLYADGSQKRGSNHIGVNRLRRNAYDGALEESQEDVKNEFLEGRFGEHRLQDDNFAQAMSNVAQNLDYEPLVQEFVEENDDYEEEGFGRYPHLHDDDGERYIEMTDEVPDLVELHKAGFFGAGEDGDDAWNIVCDRLAEAAVMRAKTDRLRESKRGFVASHKHNTDWSHPDDANAEETVHGFGMKALGHYGGLDGNVDDLGARIEDAFPGVYFSHLDERQVIPAFRQFTEAKDSGRRLREDRFTPSGDEIQDAQTLEQLNTALASDRYQDYDGDALADFKAGKEVALRFSPRKGAMADTVRMMPEDETAGGGDEVSQSRVEGFVEDMPKARVPASDSLNGFFGAFQTETAFAHPDDPLSSLSLGNKPNSEKMAYAVPHLAQLKLRGAATSQRRVQTLYNKDPLVRAPDVRHDKEDPEHRTLIPNHLMGFHEDLREPVTDEEVKAFMSREISQRRYDDPTGQMRSTPQVLDDIVGDGFVDHGFALYDADQFREWKSERNAFFEGERESYPQLSPLTTDIKNNRQLMQEMATLERGTGSTAAERRSFLNKNVLHRESREREDGGRYLISYPPDAMAYETRQMLFRERRAARARGDELREELLTGKLAAVAKEHPHPQGALATDMLRETKVKHAHQNIDAILTLFNNLYRPAVEAHDPDAFDGSKNNDEAYVHTAYGLHFCDKLLGSHSPSRLMEMVQQGRVMHRGKAFPLKSILSDENVKALKGMRAERVERKEASGKLSLKDHFDKAPTGHELLHFLAHNRHQGTPDAVNPEMEKSTDIMSNIVEEVKAAAAAQNIPVEDAFVARYAPVQMGQKSARSNRGKPKWPRRRRQSGSRETLIVPYTGFDDEGNAVEGKVDELDRRLKRTRADYARHGRLGAEGGQHMQVSEDENILHGGGTIYHGGKALSMKNELQALHSILSHGNTALRQGSDYSFHHPKMGKLPNTPEKLTGLKEVDVGAKAVSKLHRLADALFAETSERQPRLGAVKHSSSVVVPHSLPVGGQDLHTIDDEGNRVPIAPLAGILANREHQHHSGRVVKPNRNAFLNGNHLVLEDSEFAPTHPPVPVQIPVSRVLTKVANPTLNGYQGENISQSTAYNEGAMNEGTAAVRTSYDLSVILDDSIIRKDEGRPPPVKFMHRIFDVDDMEHLRGFTGDWVLSHYPQGEQLIVTRKGKELTAYGADGDVKLDDVFSEEVDRVHEKDFVVHAVLHDGVLTFLDLLKTADEETHNMPTKDRIRHLRAQYESSEHIKMPEPINTKRSDDEGLRVAIEGLRKEENIDILLRDANATYMKGEPRHPKWVLLSKEKMVDVIILSRAGGSYTVGVGPLMHPENYGKRAQKIGDEHYMMVGSAKGPRGLKEGDFATVRCTGVSASKSEHPVYRVRAAKMTDNEPLAADSVETLAILAGDHHVPQRVSMKKGRIVITFPGFDDEVFCKTRIEDSLWVVEPQQSTWGNEYLVRLAKDQQPYWSAAAAMLLKEEAEDEPEYDEVNPEPPAGHSKKPKKVLDEEEEVIKRGLDVLERALDHLSKEKITSTGVQGLGIGYATPDESPRGPTQNINDDTMPDFDPAARDDSDIKPPTAKKTKRLRTDRGEEARLTDDGTLQVL